MFYRLSRLRFIVVRSCCISLVIIFFMQVWELFNAPTLYDRDRAADLPLEEISFWEQLSRRDRYLTDKKRVETLKEIQKPTDSKTINWTAVLLENYKRKQIKLNERNFQSQDKVLIQSDQPDTVRNLYEIYEETTVYEHPKFCSVSGIFHSQCPFSNCRWTCEEPAVYYQHRRRASVFHHADIKPDLMPKKMERRSFNDIWIMWIDEANHSIEHLNTYHFNWTLSYRQDSEISIGSYGILIRRDQNKALTNEYHSVNNDFIELLKKRNLQVADMALEDRILSNFRYRQRHALWFISNCYPKHRLNYYEQLKKYYPIQAIGSCTENTCNRSKACEVDHTHLALFYLAFESQTCKDYVTEKFWRSLYYGMIPVVLGPAKQSYIDLGLPASAFVHVEDYLSAQDLAKDLHRIGSDYFVYREYFLWLREFDVFYSITDLEPLRMCELCMRLNMQPMKEHSYYTNINKWHHAECDRYK